MIFAVNVIGLPSLVLQMESSFTCHFQRSQKTRGWFILSAGFFLWNFFFCVWLEWRNPLLTRQNSFSFVQSNRQSQPCINVSVAHSAFKLCVSKWCLHLLVILFQCLQEVDEYDSFYRSNMESLGYSGIYIQRTGQRKRDGCAIFYKPSWYD